MTSPRATPPRHDAAWERTRTVLQAYGANPQRWPPSDRAAVAALVAQHAELRQLAREEASMDVWLEQAFPALPDAALVARILAAAPQPSPPWQERLAWWLPLPLPVLSWIWALALALGIWGGTAVPQWPTGVAAGEDLEFLQAALGSWGEGEEP
ncbi:MAG: hypothetical protein H7831_02665 [Magnetococcus sp. WYHC-3]